MSAMIYGNGSDIDRNKDTNSYSSLCKHSMENCDFCEKVFNNRYSSLVHNVKHIIIPLLKLTIHRCEECLFCFTSQDDLNSHIVRKHEKKVSVPQATERREDVKPMWINETAIAQCDKKPVDIVSVTELSPDILQSIVKRETQVERTGTGLKNRIVFEDQDEDMISVDTKDVCIDLTADCGVDVEPLHRTPRLQRDHAAKYQAHMNGGESNMNDTSENWTSVHYDDLVADGKFKCKFCGKIYTNRLRLIQHQPKHIRLKRARPVLCPHCDWFLSGNYRSLQRHIDRKHTITSANVKCQKLCRHCGLKYYNYTRHETNYHEFIHCNICERKLDRDHIQQHILAHESEGFPKLNGQKTSWDTKVVKMCEMCFSFLRNKQNVQYVHLKDVNELGVRQLCEKCGTQHFEVKLVKLVQRPRESYCDERKKRPMSNKDRLKNIQHRLKKINNMNKY